MTTGTLPTPTEKKNIQQLPDKLLVEIFKYLKLNDLCRLAIVCRKWKPLVFDPKLWTRVSLRPEYNGLHIVNPDQVMQMIGSRFGTALRYIELPAELITPHILHELANKCPNLKYLTLDFSNAMQLHDFNDMNSFPCNLRSLTICLSEVIFMEGFMRKVYQHLSSLEVLHLIGTFELGDEEQEEIYEVINIGKIKAQTPNLKIINLYGIGFVDDSHVEMLSSNCIHLETLALNFCLRVKGTAFKNLVTRCKKLRTLLLQHCSLEDQSMLNVDWEQSKIKELDLTSTELSTDCLMQVLCKIPSFTYLGLGYCEFFNDQILEQLIQRGKLDFIKAMDLSYTVNLSDGALLQLLSQKGRFLEGLNVVGKAKLNEQFFCNVIPFIRKLKVLICGTANGWFLKLGSRILVDQIIISLSNNCTKLERLEMQWDPDTIRSSDNSSKFIDQLRIRCPELKCMTLSDGEYYEMVKSNFERADRKTTVRTLTNYNTNIVSLLSNYKDLLFN